MKRLLPIFIIPLMVGCATTTALKVPDQPKGTSNALANSKLMQNIWVGATKEEVAQKLGTRMVVGFEELQSDSGPEAIAVANPYRSKHLPSPDGLYEIDYYLTHTLNADGSISDEELTPLVFKDGRLAGKGWKFLNSLR